jgi:hypothetical protein
MVLLHAKLATGQNTQVKLKAMKKIPVSGYEPTRLPQPPAAA